MKQQPVKTEVKLDLSMSAESLGTQFEEEQTMDMLWVWLLMGATTAIVIGMTMYQLFTGNPVGNKPATNAVLIGVSIMMAGMLALFSKMKMVTRYDQDGIHMSYFPFGSKQFSWDEIEHAEVLNYGFVGYGMRLSRKYGTVYNTAGKYGLFVKLKNGRKFTFGTQRKADLEAFMNDIGRGLG